MSEKEKKKGKTEEVAEKTGETVEKGFKKGFGVVKSFGKGAKEAVTQEREDSLQQRILNGLSNVKIGWL